MRSASPEMSAVDGGSARKRDKVVFIRCRRDLSGSSVATDTSAPQLVAHVMGSSSRQRGVQSLSAKCRQKCSFLSWLELVR